MFNNFDDNYEISLYELQLINNYSNEVNQLFNNLIQNQPSSINKVINIIKLILKNRDLILTLNLNSEKILSDAIELISLKKWDDLSTFCEYIIQNNFLNEFKEIITNKRIPLDIYTKLEQLIPIDEKNVDQIISFLLVLSEPDQFESFYKELLEKMLKDKPTRIEYLKIFNFYYGYNSHNAKSFLKYYYDAYEKYGDDFIEALDSFYLYNPNTKEFVQKYENKLEPIPDFEYANELISKLFELVEKQPDNYQIYFGLKCIASAFPFFFEKDPIRIFNSVLPAFGYYSLTFEENIDNESQMKKAKSTIVALSFLWSTLNSIKIFEYFCDWIFNEIEKFSDSQVLCFNLIMNSFFSYFSSEIGELFAFSMKKNINVFKNMFTKELPENDFGNQYKTVLFQLINSYRHSISDITIFYFLKLKMQKNEKFSFNFFFNNRRVFFLNKLFKIDHHYENKKLDSLSYFLNTKMVKFMFSFNDFKYDINDQFNNFIENINNKFVKINQPFSELPKLPEFLYKTEENVFYCIKKGAWIYEYIFENVTFSLLPEHHKILKEVIDYCNNNEPPDNYNIYSDFYYDFKKIDNSLFFLILQSLFFTSLTNAAYNELKKLVLSILMKKEYIDIFINYISEIIQKDDENELNLLNLPTNLFKFLQAFFNYENYHKDYLISFIDDKFIDLILQPQYRNNKYILSTFADLFLSFDEHKVNIRVSHLIGFMLQSNDENLIEKAIHLCSKFNYKQLSHLDSLQQIYNNSLVDNKYSIILAYCINGIHLLFWPQNLNPLNFLFKILKFTKMKKNQI